MTKQPRLKPARLTAVSLLLILCPIVSVVGQTTARRNPKRGDVQTAKPLIKKAGLLGALRLKALSTQELVREINQRGVDFYLTRSIETALIDAGASPLLIEAVRANWRPGEAEIQKLLEAVKSHPGAPEAHYKLAEGYRHWSKYAEAATEYVEAIRINPKLEEAYFGLAECRTHVRARFGSREYEAANSAAAEAYKQAIRLRPEHVEAHIGLGNAYSSLGRSDEAIEAFKIAIHIKPEAKEAYESLASEYYTMERYFDAIEAYNKVILLDAEDLFAYRRLGDIYMELESFDDAIKYYHKQIGVRRTAINDCDLLWEAYRKSNRLREGAENFKQLILVTERKLQEQRSLRIQSDLDWSNALEVEITRNLAWAHLSLGMMYVYLEDKQLAMKEYKAIKGLGNDGMVVSHANQLFDAIYK